MLNFVSEEKRTHYCGNVTAEVEGQYVVVMGWVETRRDHGGLVFIDLRDREGLVQVVLNPANEATKQAKEVRNEFVIAVKGKVRRRPTGMTNKKLRTGEIEIEGEDFAILSKADTPPFQISDENVHENLRLQYRYLDLRHPRLQSYLKTRHNICHLARNILSNEGFLEVETPILYKSTPEGARDYLVPSRVHNGEFYALPQSPQTLKQLLMIGGIDKYFQIARCFRDEDLRADRQPEFSQIDIELSFVNQDDVLAINEKLLRGIWKEIKGVDVGKIDQMTYQVAMDRYGCDKPDRRFGMEIQDLGAVLQGCGFKVFEDSLSGGRVVRGIAVPKGGEFSRGQFDKLTDQAKKSGGKGLVWIKSDTSGKLSTPIAKFFEEAKLKEIFKACGAVNGDAALVVADEYDSACRVLSDLRLLLGEQLGLIDKTKDDFLWVTDFPLLEYSPEDKRWISKHHPFTMPREDQWDILLEGREEEYGKLLSQAYDMVCNGHEIIGGSIRIHRNDIQQAIFKALGMDKAEVESRFGFFINALNYGTPPHGGAAWGLDRAVMILCGTDAIREVIAFPKTLRATCLMSDAPSKVDREQLLELGIRLAQGPKA